MNHPKLAELGDRLERAVTRYAEREAQRKPAPRKLVVAAAAIVVAVPGIAFGASAWISEDEVAAGLPAGTKALAGTDPTCTAVRPGVEYHCLLARPPAPEVSDWKGAVEHTVDATKHVNGGCRSLRSDGLAWRCYLGEAAVEQRIIAPAFLGEYAPTPGVG
jgi:hypothetical protein